ncbi:MAG: YwaF family protein [Firmicutes bacterium]|nr:YwaF family protein [Bacillota bacterium]
MWTTRDAIIYPISLAIMLCIAVGCYFIFRGKCNKYKIIPFQIVAGLFLGLEIAKQLVGLIAFDEYRMFWLPLHICSGIILFLPFAVFLKQKWNITKVFWDLSFVVALMGSVALLGSPSDTVSQSQSLFIDADFMGYHSFFFHLLMVMTLMLYLALRPYRPHTKDVFWGGIIFAAYLGFVAIMANVLQSNFAMFLNNNLFNLNNIRDSHGYYLFQFIQWLIYMVCYTLSGIAILLGTRIYFALLKRKNRDKVPMKTNPEGEQKCGVDTMQY